MVGDEPERQLGGLAKYAAAFFSRSRSARRRVVLGPEAAEFVVGRCRVAVPGEGRVAACEERLPPLAQEVLADVEATTPLGNKNRESMRVLEQRRGGRSSESAEDNQARCMVARVALLRMRVRAAS